MQNWVNLNCNNSIHVILNSLRDSLLRGDAAHAGEELNAGQDANIGIINFYNIFSIMDEQTKNRIRQFRAGNRSIADILDNLFRDNNTNGNEIRYCIQLLGRQLEQIIDENSAELSGIQINIQPTKLINIIKTQFGNPQTTNSYQPGQNEQSKANPALTFNEAEWVVSLISPSIGSTKIIVEGIKDNKLFVGCYYALAATNSKWKLIPDCLHNTGGIFNKIKVFESCRYNKLLKLNQAGGIIFRSNSYLLKYDFLKEISHSLVRSHRVPVENVEHMIKLIKKEMFDTNLANLIVSQTLQTSASAATNQVTSNTSLFSLFIPYERFGSKSYFGTGKHNCVTWCESKLAIAGCSTDSSLDVVKAKPITHTLGRLY